MKNKDWNWKIEITGWLGLVSLFFAVWIKDYFWRFAGTTLILWFITIMIYIAEEQKKKSKKNENKI